MLVFPVSKPAFERSALDPIAPKPYPSLMQRFVFTGIGIGFLLLVVAGCFSFIGTKTPPSETSVLHKIPYGHWFISNTTPPAEVSPEELEKKAFNDGFRRQVQGEYGTPVLNKIPYIQRFFVNTSIGYHGYIWDGYYGMSSANTTAVVSPDGKYLLVGESHGGAVSIFNLLDPADHQFGLVPSRNDGSVQNLERTDYGGWSYSLDTSKPAGSKVAWLQFTPDASAFLVYRVYCAGVPLRPDASVLETMELFDRATGQLLRTIPIEPKFKAGAVSPDGRFLLVAGASSLEYWDLTNGQKVGSVPLYGIGALSDLRCTPDGRFVFLVPMTGNIHVYDFRSMSEVASLPVGRNTRPLIDISPDGRVLVVVTPSLEAVDIVHWSLGGAIMTGSTNDLTFAPFNCPFYRIQRYEVGTWEPFTENTSGSNDEETTYRITNVRFSRDGNRLIAIGDSRRESPKSVELRRGLFECDLSSSDRDWQPLRVDALPLHADGKFLLDGRLGSVPTSQFVERLGTSSSVRLR